MSSMKDLLEDVRVLVFQGCSDEYIASTLEISEDQVKGAIDILMDDPDFRNAVDPIDDDDATAAAWRNG